MSNRPIRGFYIHSESWYHEANKRTLENRGVVENIMFGLYYKNDGADFEVSANWHDLGGKSPLALRIDIFEDAFQAFTEFSDVFGMLTEYHGKNPTKQQFVNILKSCGFEDLTERTNPHDRPRKKTRRLELED